MPLELVPREVESLAPKTHIEGSALIKLLTFYINGAARVLDPATTPHAFNVQLDRVLENPGDKHLLVLHVSALDMVFSETNNHYVGILIERGAGAAGRYQIQYIDPMGRGMQAAIQESIRAKLGTDIVFQPYYDGRLQYADIEGTGHRRRFREGDNDYDCGPILVYLLVRSAYGLSLPVITGLESRDISKRVGQKLRDVYLEDNGKIKETLNALRIIHSPEGIVAQVRVGTSASEVEVIVDPVTRTEGVDRGTVVALIPPVDIDSEFKRSMFDFEAAVLAIEEIADITFGSRDKHPLRSDRTFFGWFAGMISINRELRGKLTVNPITINGERIIDVLVRYRLLDRVDLEILDKKLEGQTVKPTDLVKLPSIDSKLPRLYRSHKTLPKLLEDPDIIAQNIDKFYVQLEIVLQQDREKAEKRKEERRGYESIEGKKASINLNNIFDAVEGDASSVNRILILGRAGVGKTTLMHYISYKWGKRELWNDKFDYVFRVRLRELTTPSIINDSKNDLASFIHYCLRQEGEDGIDVREIRRLIGNNRVLLLVDGYDEIAHLADNGVVRVTMDRLLAHPCIIMTSRPNAISNTLARSFQRQVENIGLDEKGIDQYIKSQIADTEERESLVGFLGINPTVRELCTTPINAAMMCLIWQDPQIRKRFGDDILSSNIYNEMEIWLGKRYLRKFRDRDVTNITLEEVTNLPEFKTLKELAFEGFRSGRLALDLDGCLVRRVIAKNSPVTIEEVHRFGLLRSDSKEKRVIDSRHEFIHLTFQEYLVALHLKEALLSEDQEKVHQAAEFIAYYKYHPRFLTTMKFLVGLVSIEAGERGFDLENKFWEIIACHQDGVIEIGSEDEEKIKLAIQLLTQTRERGTRLPVKEALTRRVSEVVAGNVVKWNKFIISGRYPEQIIMALQPLTRDGEKSVRESATDALEKTKKKVTVKRKKVPELLPLLQNSDYSIRSAAIRNLKEIGQSRATDVVPALLLLLQDGNRDGILSAIEVLGEIGGEMATVIVPVLLPLLQNHDLGIKCNAAVVLGKIGQGMVDIVVPALLPLLREDEPPHYGPYSDFGARTRAATALKMIGQSRAAYVVQTLLPLLRDGNKDIRRVVVDVLGEVGVAAKVVVPVLLPLLRDHLFWYDPDDNYIKEAAVEALRKVGRGMAPDVVPALISLLRYHEVFIRQEANKVNHAATPHFDIGRSAVSALEEIGEEMTGVVVPALIPLLRIDALGYGHTGATRVLIKIGMEKATVVVPVLLPLLRDSDSRVRIVVIKVLRKVGKGIVTDVVPALIPRLRDSDYHVRASTAEALEEIGQRMATIVVPAMISQLQDRDYIHIATIKALGKVGQGMADVVVPALLPLLKHGDQDIKRCTVWVLGEMGQRMATVVVPALLPLLRDPWNNNTKVATIKTLANIGRDMATDIIPALLPLLRDGAAEVRKSTVEVLGEIGQDLATYIVPSLLPLLRDHDYIKVATIKVLGKIGKEMSAMVVPALLPLLRECDDEIKKGVVGALKYVANPSIEIIEQFNAFDFTDVTMKNEILTGVLKKVLNMPVLGPEHLRFISNCVGYGISFSITRDFKIIFAGKEYELPGNAEEKLVIVETLANLISRRCEEKRLPNPLVEYTTNAPVFVNVTETLPKAAADIASARSLVAKDAVLNTRQWQFSVITEANRSSHEPINNYFILERRTIFGDIMIYRINSDLTIADGCPFIVHPDKIDLEFKQQLFNINVDRKLEFYVTSTVISLDEQRSLLTGIKAAAENLEKPKLLSILSATISAAKIPSVLNLSWSEYRAHVDVIKLRAYELLGMKPGVEEIVEDRFEEFASMFARREELSESILTNPERKQKRIELDYINGDDRLREFYETLNTSLFESFGAAASIHSGMVANNITSTHNGYVEQIASSASSILEYLGEPLPFAGYITKAITAGVKQAITISQNNAVKRLLKLVPVLTQTDSVVEKTSRAITIALAYKILDSGLMARPGVLSRVKKWGGDRVGVFDDLDTEYKQQAAACAIFLIKKAMLEELTAEVFASNQVVQLFDPELSLEDFEERRRGIAASIVVPTVATVEATAGAGTEVISRGAASVVPVSRIRTLEEIIRHTQFDYKSVLMRIEDLADAILGKGKHPLRAHRTWYEARYTSKISIKRELIGFMPDTPPNKVDGNLVVNVLKKYKLLSDEKVAATILGISHLIEPEVSITTATRSTSYVAALGADRGAGGAGVGFVALEERRRGSAAGASLANAATADISSTLGIL